MLQNALPEVLRIKLLNLVFGPAPSRSYKFSAVGNNWLVGNANFLRNGCKDFSDFLHEVSGL